MSDKVPTLKFLVSQSLAEHRSDQNNKTRMTDDTADHHTNPTTFHTESLEENEKCVPDHGTCAESSCRGDAGSGDITSTVTGFLQTSDIDVNNLLSAAYSKGTEWLQAGAEIAYNMFGEEEEAENNKKNVEEDVEVTEETFERLVIDSSKKVQQKFSSSPEIDDTAYYNGYSIRVKGRGVALDALFLNGSGPSQKEVEIRISLQRDPTPDLHATIHAFYEPEENKLTIKYYHGVVEGLIEIVCPLEVNVNDLKNDHKGNYIVVTVP